MSGDNILDVEVEAGTPITGGKENEQFLEDPAIVSYSRKHTPTDSIVGSRQVNGLPVSKAEAIVKTETNGEPLQKSKDTPLQSFDSFMKSRQQVAQSVHVESSHSVSASATLTTPFDEMSLRGYDVRSDGLGASPMMVKQNGITSSTTCLAEGSGINTPAGSLSTSNRPKRKAKRSQASKFAQIQTTVVPDSDLPASPSPLSSQNNRNGKSKGWRQTPLLTESNLSSEHVSNGKKTSDRTDLQAPRTRFTPDTASQHQQPRKSHKEADDLNGWATEEATDIQDMGDFDFEENLSRFDKRKIFEQIRKEDTTNDEARLVSHNRLGGARPGTAGGKNIHYTENVLSSPVLKDVEHSSDSEHQIGSRTMSRSSTKISNKTSTKKVPSRKGSAITSGECHEPYTTFINDSASRTRRKSNHSQLTKTDSSNTRLHPSSTTSMQTKACLRVSYNNRICPSVSPLQMLELERLATTELNLSESLMTENAARCIAQTTYSLATLAQETDEQHSGKSPSIVVLAGNHKTGSRAIAAARHLINHDARITLCILGPLEREDELIDDVRRQLGIFRRCGGHAIIEAALKTKTPVDLIIDALLGMHVTFDDLRAEDQASYFKLMSWANSNGADILSIDIPSGVDASSGKVAEYDEQSLGINASRVLSLGAPKTGLLAFLATTTDPLPDLCVADIGIGPVAWKKSGTRKRRGPEFRGKWTAELLFVEGSVA